MKPEFHSSLKSIDGFHSVWPEKLRLVARLPDYSASVLDQLIQYGHSFCRFSVFDGCEIPYTMQGMKFPDNVKLATIHDKRAARRHRASFLKKGFFGGVNEENVRQIFARPQRDGWVNEIANQIVDYFMALPDQFEGEDEFILTFSIMHDEDFLQRTNLTPL